MKNIIKYLSSMTLCLLAFASCQKDISKDGQYRRPAVRLYAPMTNATVTQKPGAVVTLEGVNLDNVAAVIMGGIEAQVTSISFGKLQFILPLSPEFIQNKITTTQIVVKSTMDRGDSYSWKRDYFVFVDPYEAIVTSCTPLSGTIGDEVTLAGYNFDKISAIKLGDHIIASDAFVSATKEQIKFSIPDSYTLAGDNVLKLNYMWVDQSGAAKESTFASDFTVKIPTQPEMTPSAGTPAFGDVLIFKGTNMDVFESVYVGKFKASIVKTATELKVTIPVGDYTATRAGTTAVVDVVGHYGKPDRAVTLKSALTINTTPPTVVEPTYASVTPVDGGDAAPYRFYLKKEVAVVGTGLNNIKKITVGELEATIKDGANATNLTFIMPEAFTFNTMTQQVITAYYGDANLTSEMVANAAVYPYYLWKGKKLMAQDATNINNNFFSFDTGEVVSGREFLGLDAGDIMVEANMWDSYIKTAQNKANGFSTTTTMTGAGILNRDVVTSEQSYMAVKPYTFVTVGSSNTTQINDPAGSVSQIRNQRYADNIGNVSGISSIFDVKEPVEIKYYYSGTPMVSYRVLTDSESDNNAAIKAATIETLSSPTIFGSTGSARFGDTEKSNIYVIGSVILVQYGSYAKANQHPKAVGDVYKSGYMVITGGSLSMTPNVASSYIEFDCLWPYNKN